MVGELKKRFKKFKKNLTEFSESWRGVIFYIVIGLLVTYYLIPSSHTFWFTISVITAPILFLIKKQDWTPYIYGGMVFAAFTYFLIGVVLATKLPVVAVSSGSMDHGINSYGYPCGIVVSNYTESFENWWKLCGPTYKQFGISKEQFENFPFKEGLKVGDMLILKKGDYHIGDVIVYEVGEQYPIIHRIVKINPDGTYQTKGDHNAGQNPYEKSVRVEQIYGKAILFQIPKLGYLRVIASWFGI